jgi:hypothetical protein
MFIRAEIGERDVVRVEICERGDAVRAEIGERDVAREEIGERDVYTSKNW